MISKEILNAFHQWENDDNVIKFKDGYATQCANYKNRLKTRKDLMQYFIREYIGQ